jgi:small-conductance mechanosensitive channel
MESVLKKVGEFSGVVGDFRDMVIKTIKEVSETKEALELSKIEQDTRKKDLDAREIEIKKVEDVIALKNETMNLISQQEATAESLKRERSNFENFMAEQKKIISGQITKNEQKRLANEAEAEALIKNREALEVEKNKYKFIKDLVQKAQ